MSLRGWVLALVFVAVGVGAYVLSNQMLFTSTQYMPVESNTVDTKESETNAPMLAQEADDDTAVALRGDPSVRQSPKTDDQASIRVVGRVEDSERNVVEGASVEIQYDGNTLGTATTGTEGSYEISFALPAMWERRIPTQVLATTADGRMGLTTLFLPQVSRTDTRVRTGDLKVQPIVVVHPQSLQLEVTSDCDGGIPATVHLVHSLFGQYTVRRTRKTDKDGSLRLERVPQGHWLIVASAPGCGQGRVDIAVPRKARAPINIVVPRERSVTVLVREATTEKPVPGANVYVGITSRDRGIRRETPLFTSPSQLVTDERGQCLVSGLAPDDHLNVRAEADGYPVRFGRSSRASVGPGVSQAKPGETTCVVELPLPRTIRWPMEDKGHGVPTEGATIVLKPFANSGLNNIPSTGRVEDGHIVVEGWGPGYASAIAYADGVGAARLHAKRDSDVGSPAAFYPLRKIELFAKEPDGSPAIGVWLSARGPGNNLIQSPAETNDDGYAVLRDLYSTPGWRVNCFVSRTNTPFARAALGAVDLSNGDGRFEHTFPRERTLRVTITVDGAPPPKGFNQDVVWGETNVSLKPDAQGVCDVVFAPLTETGIASLPIRMGGYRVEKPVSADLSLPDPIPVPVALRRTYKVLVNVTLPKDGRHRVYYQAWDADKKSWQPSPLAHMSTGADRADANGVVTFGGLAPGRYRAVDATSGLATVSFDVGPSSPTASVALDLSGAGWAKGKVVPPDGVSYVGFSVGAEGERPSGFAMYGMGPGTVGKPVDRTDGTFWFRTVAGQPKRIRLYHPTCLPHPTKGFATVDGPIEGIELYAIQGPTATVTLDPPPQISMNPGSARRLTAYLYRDAMRAEEKAPIHVMLNGAHDTLTLGGYKPGTYTLWVDVPNKAPLVMPKVTLTNESIDLGTVATNPGSTFRLIVKVKDGQSPPRMHIFATAQRGPTYSRRADGAGTLTIRGICKGSFRVNGMSYGSSNARIDEVIEFDGVNDVERVIDLR